MKTVINSLIGLEAYVLEAKPISSASALFHESAYELWDRVWRQTFYELDGKQGLCSDAFTRQDERICLFLNGHCIALVCHRYADLYLSSTRRDSYFEPWTDEDLRELIKHGSRVAIGSQITIHPAYRKSKIQSNCAPSITIKEILTYLSLRQICEKRVDAITGVMRADKGMHDLFYRFGAQSIAPGRSLHNVKVDLVAFFPRATGVTFPKAVAEPSEPIWNARKVEESIGPFYNYLSLNSQNNKPEAA